MKYSGIEWTEATWNPSTGCNKVSTGCKQWGAWGADGVRRSKKANGRILLGREWNEEPV